MNQRNPDDLPHEFDGKLWLPYEGAERLWHDFDLVNEEEMGVPAPILTWGEGLWHPVKPKLA